MFLEEALQLHRLFILYFNFMKVKHDAYKTVLTISLALVVFYYLYHSVFFLSIFFIVAGFSLLFEKVACLVHVLWMKLAKLLSYVAPNILLTIIFFLVLTPIALLQKVLSKNSAFRAINGKTSAFYETNKKFERNHFEKPW